MDTLKAELNGITIIVTPKRARRSLGKEALNDDEKSKDIGGNA